ncbi:hypothetical protein V2594_14840, partial [Tenacibaculum maritimum]
LIKRADKTKAQSSDSLKRKIEELYKYLGSEDLSEPFTLEEFQTEMERRGYKKIENFSYDQKKDRNYMERILNS